jgi:hypothetical protein
MRFDVVCSLTKLTAEEYEAMNSKVFEHADETDNTDLHGLGNEDTEVASQELTIDNGQLAVARYCPTEKEVVDENNS